MHAFFTTTQKWRHLWISLTIRTLRMKRQSSLNIKAWGALAYFLHTFGGYEDVGAYVGHHKLHLEELKGHAVWFKMCRSERACFSVRTGNSKDSPYRIECHHGMGLPDMSSDVFSYVYISKDFRALALYLWMCQQEGAELNLDEKWITCPEDQPQLKTTFLEVLRDQGLHV